MSRAKVRKVSPPRPIVPVAHPVDTYVRPAEPAPSNLHQLAQGLASADRGLASFLSKRQAVVDEEAAIRGRQAALKGMAPGEIEGVRRGLLPIHRSNASWEAYEQQRGELEGKKLRARFLADAFTWDEFDNGDTDAFSQRASTWIAENVPDDASPEYLKGIQSQLEAMVGQGIDLHSTESNKSRYRDTLRLGAEAISIDLDLIETEGVITKGSADFEAASGVLQAQYDALRGQGIADEDARNYLLTTVLMKAEEYADEGYLQIFDTPLQGDETALSNDPAIAAKIDATKERIETKRIRQETTEANERDDLEKQQHNEALSGVYEGLASDPAVTVPEDILQTLSRRDPEIRLKIARARETLAKQEVAEDEATIAEVQAGIFAGSISSTDLIALHANGVIRNATTLRALMTTAKDVSRSNLEGRGILTSKSAKLGEKLIISKTSDSSLMTDPFGNKGLSAEGLEALNYRNNLLLAWEADNPDANAIDREKAVQDINTLVLDAIEVTDGMTSGGDFTDPSSAPDQEVPQSTLQVEPETQSDVSPEPDEADSNPFFRIPSEEEVKDALSIDAGIGRPRELDTAAYEEWRRRQGVEEPGNEDELSPTDDAEQEPPSEPEFELDLSPQQLERLKELGRKKGLTDEETMKVLRSKARSLADKISLTLPEPVYNEDIQNAVARTSIHEEPLTTKFVPPASNPSINKNVITRYKGKRLPVSIRNNNMGAVSIPGSIKNSWAARQPGFIGVTKRPKNEGGYYAKYATPEHGVAASSKLLEQYGASGIDTPTAIVERWSTDKSAHKAYADTLTKYVNDAGFEAGRYTRLNLSDANVRIAVLKAKSAHESGVGEPVYKDEVFERGAKYRFGGTSDDLTTIHTASDRGYDPNVDDIEEGVKAALIATQAAFGQALPVVSGFRDAKQNAKAKGARHSQHVHGNAVDISVRDMPIEDRIRLINLASENGFTGIGVYENSLHFDLGKPRYWGPSHRAKSLPAWARSAINEHMKRNA